LIGLVVAAKSPCPHKLKEIKDEEDNEIDAELSHITQKWDDDASPSDLDRHYYMNVVSPRKKANRARSDGKVTHLPKKTNHPF
jgi:hypothetical protein